MKRLFFALSLLLTIGLCASAKGNVSPDSLVTLALGQKATNPALAEKYLREAADEGSPRGMAELGVLYVFTPQYSARKQEGLRLLESAAKGGYSAANDYLGLLYFQNKDYSKAKSYFDARGNDHEGFAYAALGSMYLEGNGVPESGAKARENYHQSALKGYPRGMSLYGNLLNTKNGGSINYPDAFFWYYVAGDLGENYSRVMLFRPRLPEAQATDEVGKDAQQAIAWIEKVHTGMKFSKQPLYKKGFIGGLKDREKAAEAGDDWSRFYLGSMNYNGDFLNQNYARAIYYYEPISANGKLPKTVLALVNERLADMYRAGKGVKADAAKAAHYSRLAAAQK